MKKAAIGSILLIIGLLIISPIEEIFILLPLSIYFDMPELILAFNALAIICLIGAVYLLGTSAITGPLHRHLKMTLISLFILIIAIYWHWC